MNLQDGLAMTYLLRWDLLRLRKERAFSEIKLRTFQIPIEKITLDRFMSEKITLKISDSIVLEIFGKITKDRY